MALLLFEYKGVHNSLRTLIKVQSALIVSLHPGGSCTHSLIRSFLLPLGDRLPLRNMTVLHHSAPHLPCVLPHDHVLTGTPCFWTGLQCSLENYITLCNLISIGNELRSWWRCEFLHVFLPKVAHKANFAISHN